jgi:Secretion system C-terminal sorting domain
MRCLTTLLLLTTTFCHAQIITTIAGNGTIALNGDNLQATASGMKPNTIAIDGEFIYFIDTHNCMVRKIDAMGITSVVAGDGTFGYGGDNGPATNAQLDAPVSIALDSHSNLYVSTAADHRIRKITNDGIIITIAGTGSFGYNGDNRPATSAELFYPYLGGVDDLGNIYFGDYDNHRVRKISNTGIITTIAGNGTNTSSGNNGPATAAGVGTPGFVFLSTIGDIYVPDNSFNCIYKITTSGIITTIAGTGASGYSGDGGPATNATFLTLNSVTMDFFGNIYLGDCGANVVRKIDPTGIISTVAGTGVAGFSGDDGPATAAELDCANFVTINSSGNVFVADYNNDRIRKITFNPEAVPGISSSNTTLTLYPNPAGNELTITSPMLTEGTVVITNLLGQAVLTQRCHAITTTIDVADLPQGVYLVSITGLAGTAKFIKL